jgi:outer membrane protein assembly factor BamD (BamD/ComL family)
MAIHSLKTLVPCIFGVFVLSAGAFGCGPFFEEAPPMLPYYLDRLPAKSLGDLYVETTSTNNIPTPDVNAIADIPGQVGKMSRKKLIESVDKLLVQARANYQDGQICNELNDMRDALSSRATDGEVGDYLKWREANADAFAPAPSPAPDTFGETPPKIDGTPLADDIEKRANAASPQMKPQWLYARGAIGFCAGDRYDCAKWFERVWKEFPEHPRAEAALFLSARCALRASRDDSWEGPPVPDAAPPTPQQKQDEENRRQLFEKAVGLFHQYLQKYPRGCFVADAWGWLGALDYGGGTEADALQDYINQLETPEHPEVVKSALFMCEDILAGAKADDDVLFSLVARHPLVAMGATYSALQNPTGGGQEDTENGQTEADSMQADEYRDDSAEARKWRQKALPRLAAAVAKRWKLYKPDDWPLRYLAILAQAASAVGHQDDALALTDIPAAKLDTSDDLLLARGIAFERAEREAEAIGTFQTLLEKYPKSPLAQGVRLKLAVALADNRQAGLAVIELKKLTGMPGDGADGDSDIYPPGYADMQFTDSSVSEDISDAEGEQVDQIIDALYNFAPIGELAAALDSTEGLKEVSAASKFAGASDLLKQELNAVLAERCLAAEDFVDSRRYMEAPQPLTWDALKKSLSQVQMSIYWLPIYLNDQPATALSGSLESLTLQVEKTVGPSQKAKAMIELGDAWAAARGKLLSRPLDGQVTGKLFNDNSDEAMQRRRENGMALGFKDVDDELQDRDELRHAARWWMRAARLVPGTPLAATARLKAMETIPQIASGSDYAFMRDVEKNAAGASRALYARLRSECPDSLEATKKAAYWSFPMHKPKPGDDPFPTFESLSERQQDAIGQTGYAYSDYGAFGPLGDFVKEDDIGDSGDKNWSDIFDRVVALKDEATSWDTKRLAAEVEAIRGDVRKEYSALGQSRYFDVLDDLALFLQEPNIPPRTVAAYVKFRLWYSEFITWETVNGMGPTYAQVVDNPDLKPASEYVDFLTAADMDGFRAKDLYNDANEKVTARTQSYWELERRMREFMAAYPKGRKCEAAAMLLARAVHWLTTSQIELWSPKDDEPDPDKAMEMDATPTLQTSWPEKFDYKRAAEPLDEYDREYPNGRYAADIRNYRASAAMRGHDWATALDLALAGVKDKAHPDLQPEYALILANVFGQLADADSRGDLLEAIRERPEAVQRLQDYLAKTWEHRDHPLRYLGDYLGDQLGFRLKEPPVEADQNPD